MRTGTTNASSFFIGRETELKRLQDLFLTRRELNSEVIESMQEKIARFSAPRGFAVVPVLFHLSGVTDAVYEQHFLQDYRYCRFFE